MQILVASSPAILAQDRGDLWDSGPMPAAPFAAIYAGRPLRSLATVDWKIRPVSPSAPGGRAPPSGTASAPAHWTVGLLAPTDWKGRWIAAPGATESLLLRGEVTVRPGLRRAVAVVSGLGQYEFSINGRRVGDDRLTPGWTTYDKTVLYATEDVTALLQPGRNALGFLLGNGMYDVVERDRYYKFAGFGGPLRAILHLRLDYADGTTVETGTDRTWRTLPGPITAGSAYGGEDFDARLLPAQWDQPGFDDRRWTRASLVLETNWTLHGFVPLSTAALKGRSVSADPIRYFEVHPPVARRAFPDGSIVYDFGQNAAHVPRVTVTGPAGTILRLWPSEVVNPDGTINPRTMGDGMVPPEWVQYTKATDGPETWQPRFYYVGCRYLKAEVVGENGEILPGKTAGVVKALDLLVVHSDVPAIGTFTSSNPLLGRIFTLVRWAQVSNIVSIFTDCPHREKLGWIEQLHLNGPALRYDFDLARNFRKSENDMADAQTASGFVPNIAPEYVQFSGGFRAATEWGSSFIVMPWQQYQFTGDDSLLRTHYAAMKRYLGYLDSRATGDLLNEGLGDWFDLGPNRPGFAQLTLPDFTSSAYYFLDYTTMASIARTIGQPDDAERFARKAAEIRERFNAKFFQAETGLYGSGAQAGQAIALVMRIVPDDHRAAVLDALVHSLEKSDYALTAGDVGYTYFLRALAEGGRSDIIYRMVDQDTKPGYGYQLRQGATAMTESWNANLVSSHNHFMLGQVTEWFYSSLVGIAPDPAAPGFANVLIHPSPVGDLTSAGATYDSVRGLIAVSWRRQAGTFYLKVKLPPGSTATIMLPDGSRRVGALSGDYNCSMADTPRADSP